MITSKKVAALLAVEETCIKTWAFNILRDWAQGKNCNETTEKQLPFHYISSNVPRFSISFPFKKITFKSCIKSMPKFYVLNQERDGNTEAAVCSLCALSSLINFPLLHPIVTGYWGMPRNRTPNSSVDSNQTLIFFETCKNVYSLH